MLKGVNTLHALAKNFHITIKVIQKRATEQIEQFNFRYTKSQPFILTLIYYKFAV